MNLRPLVLVIAASCGHDDPTPARAANADHDSYPPPVWMIRSAGAHSCLWTRVFVTRSPEIARFPVGCADADLAWVNDQTIVWLHSSDGDHLYRVAIGRAPVALTPPPQPRMLAVGYDDVPLAFTFWPNEADVTAWAFVNDAWVKREEGHDRLEQLETWKSQRGATARNVRRSTTLTRLAPAEAPGDDRTPGERRTAALVEATKHVPEPGQMVPLGAPPPTWWGFDAGGVRMAIRGSPDHVVPDLRYVTQGVWQRVPGAAIAVERDRVEIWPAGLEVRGPWILVSSDGRAGSLVDARNGLRVFGAVDTALSLFAPCVDAERAVDGCQPIPGPMR
jgi:hypothetical protein